MKKCCVCQAEFSVDKYFTVSKDGLYCATCDKYYCAKHMKEGPTERVAAGTDAEATIYYCPKGHTTMH